MAEQQKKTARTRGQVTKRTTKKTAEGPAQVREVTDPVELLVVQPDGQRITQDAAQVSISGGLTRNQGDFNSIRVDVGVTLPCAATSEGVQQARDMAGRLVDQFIAEELDLATGTVGDGSDG